MKLTCVFAQPLMVVCNTKAQLEYVHVARTFFRTLGADFYAPSVLIDKISASELSQKFIEGSLLVGCVCACVRKVTPTGKSKAVFCVLTFPPPLLEGFFFFKRWEVSFSPIFVSLERR